MNRMDGSDLVMGFEAWLGRDCLCVQSLRNENTSHACMGGWKQSKANAHVQLGLIRLHRARDWQHIDKGGEGIRYQISSATEYL